MSPFGAAPSSRGDHRALAVTLTIGAAYDFFFALLFVAAPGFLSTTFDLPLPGEPFYLRVIAVFFVIAGSTYLIAAQDPVRFRPLVFVAIGGRTLGFFALALSAFGQPALAGVWPPALGDLGFAIAHAVAGRRLLFR